MATSGTFGQKNGYKPYLTVKWNTDKQEITNNRSRIRLRMYLNAPTSVYFSAKKSASLDGSRFTHTSGFSGTGTKLLRTRYIWINHDSNGNGSKSINAWLNIAITFSGRRINRLSLTGSRTIKPNQILRESKFTSASVSGHLKAGGTVTLKTTIKKQQSSFWHVITIWDGGTWITDWGYTSSSPSSQTVSATAVKKMLNRMRTTTSKSFTIRVATYTGNKGKKIGHVDRKVTFYVDASEKPKLTSPSLSVNGTGFDNKNRMYIQGISKVKASMNTSTPYGAGVKEEYFQIENKKKNGKSVVSHTLRETGSTGYRFQVTDTRGRTVKSTGTINIRAYNPPSIKEFKVDRKSSTQSHVSIKRAGNWSTLSGKNTLNIKIEKKKRSGIWTSAPGGATNASSGSFNKTVTDTGISISTSYEFRVIITDKLGNSSRREVSIPTAQVLLNFHEDKGLGIGKMHEKGDLDVGGDVYFEGNIELAPKPGDNRPGFKMISQDPSGHAYIEFESAVDGKRKAYIGIPNSTSKDIKIANEQSGNVKMTGDKLYFNRKEVWHGRNVNSGSNSNGRYLQFPDGTVIINRYYTGNVTKGNTTLKVNLPIAVKSGRFSGELRTMTASYNRVHIRRIIEKGESAVNISINSETNSSGSVGIYLIGIGRWKW